MAKREEPIITAASILSEDKSAEREPAKKTNIFKKIGGLVGTVQNTTNNVNEFYENWIKPVYDNRMQISRRLNALSLVFSIIYFILYIPFLLFGKIANGLSLGREIALYVCLGTYVAALVMLLIVYATSGRSQSTKSSGHYKKATKIFLYFVRIASVAVSITALIITTTAQSELSTAVTTLGIVFAIISIVFSALPLVFGGFKGLFKWLISPVNTKYRVSFVALEWFEYAKNSNSSKRNRASQKYFEAIALSIDNTIVPAIGNKYAKAVTNEMLCTLLDNTDERDTELTAYVLNKIFSYAFQCGYIATNPCDELDLPDQLPTNGGDTTSKIKGLLDRFVRKN